MIIDRKNGPLINGIDAITMVLPDEQLLNGGVRIYTIGGLPEEVLQVEFVFDAGKKRQDKPLQAGLTMEMLLEGADGKSGNEIMEALDGFGAYIESSASLDHSTVSVYCMTKNFGPVMDIVYDILFKPDFEHESFSVLRDNLRQHYLVESEKVSVLARRGFMKEIFKDTPYGKVGEPDDYDNITTDDCRIYHERYIRNGALTVFVSGHVTPAVNNKLAELFGSHKPSESSPLEFEISRKKGKLHIHKPGAIQCGIRIGGLSIRRNHPDFPELQVLTTVLGGYFGSRLMMNIREDKGYTYGIGSGVSSYMESAMFYIATEVGKEYLDDTFVQIRHEIDRLKTEKIEENELVLVKNYLKGSLARSADGAFAMMDRFKTTYFSGLDLNYYDLYLEKISAVTEDRLMTLAQAHLDMNEMLVVVAGESN